MVNGSVQAIDISDFKDNANFTEYLTDDIIVSSDINNLPHHWKSMVRINFFCVVTCAEGEILMEVNNRKYELHTGDSLIILPTMIVGDSMVSLHHKVRLIGFSTRFLQRINPGQQENLAFQYLHNNPLRHLSDFGDLSIYKCYGELIIQKINEMAHSLLRKEILDHLFTAILYEVMADLTRNHALATKELIDKTDSKRHKRGNEIFRMFLREVSNDNGIHRSLNYFADRLCYTPKYVSNIIKQVSGRSALEWINEMAIEQIKIQLKHTNKSMKEIADEFEFPNQSFFGKYVKAHLGMSPARYREEGGENP